MSKLEQARELVRRTPLPEKLRTLGHDDVGRYAIEDARLLYYDGEGTRFLASELTPEVLAQSLHYVVRLDTRELTDESTVRLGASKHRGLPHLPPDLAWPAGMYFAAQFNLAELHRVDVHDVFPDSGMLYIFIDSESGVRVLHYDGPLDALRVTPYPDPASIPESEYYLDGFVEDARLLSFVPQALFYVGDGDAYLSRVTALVPRELRERVAQILGAPVAARDCGRRIFGRPICWQGEDEGRAPGRTRHLLFQDEHEDSTLHVWISDQDARSRNYAGCWLDASGS
jgi:hypothetical protein